MAGFNEHDKACMNEALALAARGVATTQPNPPVGCVIARDGNIVGRGWHRRAGEPHAEIEALAGAGAGAKGATAYVTLEPCCHRGRTGPCTEALLAAGVARVVFAADDPNRQVAGDGARALIAGGVEVASGLFATQAREIKRGFMMRHELGRPWVTVKIGASLDGRTALANGVSQWITSATAREDVQAWRAASAVVLTGSGTLLSDDPRLTARGADVTRQPLRVIVDSRLRCPPDAKTLHEPGEVLLVNAAANDAGMRDRGAALRAAGADLIALPAGDGRVDLTALLRELASREVNEVLVEAGPTLAGALLNANVVDELLIYLAPRLLGDLGRGMFSLGELTQLDQAVELEIFEQQRVGPDLRLRLRTKR